ncbi:MAG: DEAD/DEAH box helicase [Helicobacteraceae bacterium]|jgi:transcription-repair coupling factor (superfamily II helicase)|nr:DEAD/DEAH box helicase [Helicobacteraceae bacterium]
MRSQSIPQAAHIAASLFSFLKNRPKIGGAIVADDKAARWCADAVKLLEREVFILPDLRASFGDDLRSYQGELIALSDALGSFYESKNKDKFLISPIATIVKPLAAPTLFETIELNFGDQIDITTLKTRLLDWGYDCVDTVEQKGEVSFRGEVIDIFAVGFNFPIRILLDDELIESIRHIDIVTQKSDKTELEKILIRPALFALNGDQSQKIKNLIENDRSNAFIKDLASLGLWKLPELDLSVYLTDKIDFCIAGNLRETLDEIYATNAQYLAPIETIENLTIVPETGAFKALQASDPKTIAQFHKNKRLTIALAYETLLNAKELDPSGAKLLFTDSALSLIGADELFLSLNKPSRQKSRRKNPALLLDSLTVGDLVVHETYGVGRFLGLEQVNLLGGARDCAAIAYADEDRLLLPVENLHLIDRFVAESGATPCVDRLGKGSFARIKEGVRTKLYEIADEIIRRAAKREIALAPPILIDEGLIERFTNDAGFDYTADQIKSISEIFADLRSGKAMDRLLSGDVGFGKTEVAMNAILAVYQSGFQAALIVPTTLLSRQHFESLKNRFSPYGIDVRRLDRYASEREKKAVLEGLKNGKIGVVVGTHALLKAEFKNLALMVIDEEHKFGVKQKETLKDKSERLHLLSMSATPIPRSLNMALSKIKQISDILTSPLDRFDVRTIVKSYDEKVLKEAFIREIKRGGQIFYIYNRIVGIEAKKRAILEILPNLKILVLHSKVTDEVSENELLRFEKGEYDMLLSTTIVESGIHLPNANTIIIDGADRFGIAELHQLRGRVGRSRRQGYCYFMIEDEEGLTQEAKKRLLALENNSYLGSGSALAFYDLEIRGGGNILGADQSGHIKQIGYGLYLKMLEEALSDLGGEIKETQKNIEIRLTIKAYISAECVEEERLRLDLYRRFAQTKTIEEVYELADEIADRFGRIDLTTRQFIDLMAIKALASDRGVCVVQNYRQTIAFTLLSGAKEIVSAPSADDDDIISSALNWLRSRQKT